MAAGNAEERDGQKRKCFLHFIKLLSQKYWKEVFPPVYRIKNPVFLCEIQILYNLRSKYGKDEFKKDQEYYNDSIFNVLKCTVN